MLDAIIAATKFVISKISTNRPKQKIFCFMKWLEGGALSKIGLKGEFFLKKTQRGGVFF